MTVIVQKFGGTSIADANRIHLAARKAVRALRQGNQVVLVVSAMADTTNKLLALATQVSRKPQKRELDMLLATGEQVSIALVAMAIHEAGYDAISLTGAQAKLITDGAYNQARIRSIDSNRIHSLLQLGKIVILAGFQGVDHELNITTLGRGGSDTTAVAVAAALNAVTCEIYTDVDGVYTADPRIVPHAQPINKITYDEMLELAGLGAGVLHVRSVELAKKFNVPLRVRSSFSDNPGTHIMNKTNHLEEVVVRGATLKHNIARISLHKLPNKPGIDALLFEKLAKRNILVDDIIQTVNHDAKQSHIAFTVDHANLPDAEAAAAAITDAHPDATRAVSTGLARLSVVGLGMRSHTGVAARMFRALTNNDINVENISTSEIVISVLVRQEQANDALRAVHQAFKLDSQQPAQ